VVALVVKVGFWRLIGSLWTAAFLFIAIYVAIPDYPYGVPIWVWMTSDPNGFLHEEFYIATMWLLGYVVIWISSLVESINRVLRGFEVIPDGRVYLVRKKRF